MGPQDGVDHALRALAWLRTRRDDWHAVFVGEGEMLAIHRKAMGLGHLLKDSGAAASNGKLPGSPLFNT